MSEPTTHNPVINPCLFCGSERNEHINRKGRHWVFCYDCNASGPVETSREAAIDAWNSASIERTTLRRERDEARQLARKLYHKGNES